MSAASLLAPRPGERVLDLCAAPGGKATQLAQKLTSGLLVANEIHPARCRILSRNVERLGLDHCIVTNEDGWKLSERLPSFFHRILVDAPCSGEGMFRKNEEALSEWSPENVTMCAERQAEILEYAAQMLMPGGTLVYSTCTFSPEEDEGTIGSFLERHPEFELVAPEPAAAPDSSGFTQESAAAPAFSGFAPGRPEWGNGRDDLKKTFRLWPQCVRGEGHFLALLHKEGDLAAASVTAPGSFLPVPEEPASGKKGGRKKRPKGAGGSKIPGPDKEQRALLEEFLRSNLTSSAADRLARKNMVLFGEQLYALPEDCPDLAGLKVERPGLHLGSFRQKHFIPSHALALHLGAADALHTLDVASESREAMAYLRGETLPGDGAAGWTLVCIDGFSAGWGKVAGGVLKNHYPKGLRRM